MNKKKIEIYTAQGEWVATMENATLGDGEVHDVEGIDIKIDGVHAETGEPYIQELNNVTIRVVE